MTSDRARGRLFARGSRWEIARITPVLRTETTGGLLLIGAAALAVVWANTPWSAAYASLRELRVGPSALGLHLRLGTWAADGLLAIFFFVVGLELKREFVAGDLRDPRRAALPIVAAAGGMVVPAIVYLVINSGAGGTPRGWAVPTATDIAFALAVLAVINTHLPSGLRTFLLTLAVVDDLFAITIIAVVYTAQLHLLYLVLALLPIAAFAALVQRRIRAPWLLVPLALCSWALVHESGVHATVAGVLLGFTVPVLRRDGVDAPGPAEHLEHVLRPLSAGFAVPVFAFFAAGVTVGGISGLGDSLRDTVALGIAGGLVVGKTVGIFAATWLMARFTRADLDDDLAWTDVAGLAMLAGVGFTVSLLIGELAFGPGRARDDHVTVGVLLGSIVAAGLAAAVLRRRNRVYRRIAQREGA